MLEKNKDYIEMCVSSTDCAFTQNEPTSICIDGYVYTPYMRLPDPGEFYILISKEKFEKLQANVGINEELAKQWEINHNLLLKKTGFDTVEELVNYIYDDGPNSKTDLKTLKEIIDDAEEDYISERDKAEALEKENEELKKKLQVPDPFAEYKEMLKKLNSAEDAENLEWTLNHICGGQASVNGWMVTAKLWRRNYETLSKLIGFSSVEEIQDYLTNEAECDTLHEAIHKLIDKNKYTCEKWCNANSSNNSWKAAAECNSPKELIEKRETIEKEIQVYSRALRKWKEGTGCPSPSAAKTLIESGMSWYHAYNEIKKANEKLADSIQKWKDMTKCETPEAAATWITSYESACERGNRLAESVKNLKEEVVSWKSVTGYSTPEDFLSAKINKVVKEVSSWDEITGFSTPEKCSSYIDKLEKTLEDIKDLIEEV